ncbi:MAG: MBL fold metallo-hydrolase [Acidimicrobiia bacterium]|nr:MBL fold metallo-hydrolase [Acidimicrobiia bacterium]
MVADWHFENDYVRIRKVEVGTLGNNAYVVVCGKTGASVIVDAAADPGTIIAAAAGTNPVAILTTHGHADHVGAARTVSAELDIPVLLNDADRDICPIVPDGALVPGEFPVGEAVLDVRHTPGHTPGSTVIVVAGAGSGGDTGSVGAVLTGDTLFPGGPGATRFPYSDFDQIMDSLDREIFLLPDETVVMPGHGLDTTLGAERPALPEWRARRW